MDAESQQKLAQLIRTQRVTAFTLTVNLLVAVVLTACASATPPQTALPPIALTGTPTLVSVDKATPLPSPTALLGARPTQSPLPTLPRVPAFTPRFTAIPTFPPIPSIKLGAPGVPSKPLPDAQHFSDALDKTSAHLYRYQAHQRDVLVYFDDEGILDASEEKAIADWCFEAWTRIWEIFGGYAYTTYECVASNRHRGAEVGVTLGNSTILDSGLLKGRVTGFETVIAHEVFHAWNGAHLLFRDSWFLEGGANYYGAYIADYPGRLVVLSGDAKGYARAKDDGSDRVLSSIKNEPPGIAYTKGALVFYMLDLEIYERTQGQKSLDNVMRRLYLQQWQTAAPIVMTPPSRMTPAPPSINLFREAIIAEAGNAEFFNAFFRDYVDGSRDLREWHNGLLKLDPAVVYLPLPPHPEIK